jgi:hypothetical protein
MNQRPQETIERFTTFNNAVVEFVENCSDENWKIKCSHEKWSVGVVARHIATIHYSALNLVKMMVDGQQMPELTMEAISQRNEQHAQKHADCTQAEVLGLLRDNGSKIIDFVGGLTDKDLDRSGTLAFAGGDLSVHQILKYIILRSGTEHLESMKSAVGE